MLMHCLATQIAIQGARLKQPTNLHAVSLCLEILDVVDGPKDWAARCRWSSYNNDL